MVPFWASFSLWGYRLDMLGRSKPVTCHPITGVDKCVQLGLGGFG